MNTLDDMDKRVSGPFIRWPDGMIDCMFDHPDDEIGTIPYTACANDTFGYCAAVHAEATRQIAAGAVVEDRDYAEPEPYVDPRDAQIAALEARLAALEAKQ